MLEAEALLPHHTGILIRVGAAIGHSIAKHEEMILGRGQPLYQGVHIPMALFGCDAVWLVCPVPHVLERCEVFARRSLVRRVICHVPIYDRNPTEDVLRVAVIAHLYVTRSSLITELVVPAYVHDCS